MAAPAGSEVTRSVVAAAAVPVEAFLEVATTAAGFDGVSTGLVAVDAAGVAGAVDRSGCGGALVGAFVTIVFTSLLRVPDRPKTSARMIASTATPPAIA